MAKTKGDGAGLKEFHDAYFASMEANGPKPEYKDREIKIPETEAQVKEYNKKLKLQQK